MEQISVHRGDGDTIIATSRMCLYTASPRQRALPASTLLYEPHITHQTHNIPKYWLMKMRQGRKNQFSRFEIQILSVYLIESFFYIHGYYFFNIPGNKLPLQTSGINIVDQTLDCKIYKYFKQSNSRAKTIGSNHSCFTISTRPT